MDRPAALPHRGALRGLHRRSHLTARTPEAVGYIAGVAAASLAALTALGRNPDQPRALGTGTAATSAPLTTATPKPASPQPNVAYATPPSAATTDPTTVKPADPRLRQANAVTIPSGGGQAMLIGYEAYPALPTGHGVLVMHENTGLTDHIRDVIRRVATAGYMSFGIELLSRQGGADKLGGGYSGALANTTVDQMNADLITAIAYVQAKGGDGYAPVKVGAVGFCFGGGTTWNLVNAGAAGCGGSVLRTVALERGGTGDDQDGGARDLRRAGHPHHRELAGRRGAAQEKRGAARAEGRAGRSGTRSTTTRMGRPATDRRGPRTPGSRRSNGSGSTWGAELANSSERSVTARPRSQGAGLRPAGLVCTSERAGMHICRLGNRQFH